MSEHLPEEIQNHYESEIREDLRLRKGLGRLEFLRTQEVVRRHLPRPGMRILDVGGGTGVHSEWLLADGHQVHLIDPVVSHVMQASERLADLSGFSAEVGDARALTVDDASFDVVLLFGPLYHLTDRADRLDAWREARRVIERTGLVFGTGITRYASLLDGLAQGFLFDDRFRGIVERDLATGQHRNPTREPGWFTTAYFHHPASWHKKQKKPDYMSERWWASKVLPDGFIPSESGGTTPATGRQSFFRLEPSNPNPPYRVSAHT
ncbi:MAG: class I SAM-dependent methyltransferase [Haloechinothrix sp.]